MVYFDYPVAIPEVPGKITYRPCRKGGGYYVLLETGRRYVSDKQYTLTDRATIGRTIEDMPGMMKPSKRYLEFCRNMLTAKTVRELTRLAEEDEDGFLWNDNEDDDENNRKDDFLLLSRFLTQQKAVLQAVTERRPNDVVSSYIIQGLNAMLLPLREMMKNEPYACFLPILTEPKVTGKSEEKRLEGMTNLEVIMTLEQYETAMGRFRKQFIMHSA